jgi:hypothetical protein
MSTTNSKAQLKTFITLPENKNLTYKELCSELGLPEKTNEARASQLSKLEEFFSWKKVGNSFRILLNKKPFPLGESLPRKPIEGLWLKDLSAQILHDLSVNYLEEQSSPTSQEYKEIGLSITSALLQYGFCNESIKLPASSLLFELGFTPDLPYTIRSSKPSQTSLRTLASQSSFPLCTSSEVKKFSNLSEEALIEVLVSKIRSKGNEVLRSSLDHLKRRSLINYRYSYSFLKDRCLHLASLEEEKLIEVISLKVLQLPSIKCKTMEEVYLREKSSSFFSERNSRLSEQHEISACKRSYILSFTPEQLSLAQAYRKELNTLFKHKQTLNSTSQNYFSAFFLKEEHAEEAKQTLRKGIEFMVVL